MKHRFHVMSIIGLIVLTIPLSINASQSIKLGYIEFPPVTFTNDAGQPDGVLIDLVNKVITKAGYNLQAYSYPTNRMAFYLIEGEIDLWVGLSTLPQFKDKTLVGESEVFRIILRSFSVGNKTPIKSKQDLRGKRIIIMRGYSYGGWINFIKDPANNVIYFETSIHESAFKMLRAERADYVLAYKHPSDIALKKVKVPNLTFNDISGLGVYFVVSKETPDAKNMLENLEKAYKQLVKDGIIKPVYE